MSEAPDLISHQHSQEKRIQSQTGLRPRRKLDTLAWALGALALGWIAQALFGREELWPGLIVYALAILIFASKLGVRRQAEGKEPFISSKFFHPPIAPGVRGPSGVGVIAGALLLSGVSWFLFGFERYSTAAWFTYLGSLLLFGLGVWLAEKPLPQPVEARSGNQAAGVPQFLRQPDLWLIAILLLALFLRLFQFFSLPFGTWYDEATAGLEARRILQEPTFRPVFSVAMNQVAHHLYLLALSMQLLGDNTIALRSVSVLFGLGTVVVAYLFGREYGGRRWGLLLAVLVAGMRWHVNFSRIAMNGVDATFFEFLTLYFALRAVRARPGPLRAVTWLGLSVGLGLCFYSPYRLFVVAGILFVLIMLASHYLRRRDAPACMAQPGRADLSRRDAPACVAQPGRADLSCGDADTPVTQEKASNQKVHRSRHWLAINLGLLLIAVWLAAMPAIQYAWRDSGTFWGRAQHVSVFQNREDPNLARALANNVQKHLLMFNYKGDSNGRHNLPGAPTLDRLSAILFALGLGLAIVRRDRLSIFFLCLLVTGLMGGILTLDFEAPQSLRSIGALPAVVYFIALSLDALWAELRWAAHITRPRYSLALVIVVLGAMAFSNAYTYFGAQAHDPRVWMEFSTAETLVGKTIAELGPEPVYYASQFFDDHASVRFHAPEASAQSSRKVMPSLDPLPAREPANRPVVYFIHPDDEWVFNLARQIYPTAQFETLPAESEYTSPAVLLLYLEPEDIARVQGLEERYWPGDEWDGNPMNTSRSSVIDVVWPTDAPLNLPFVAEWRGILYAPQYGQYALEAQAPGYIELTLDGETVEGVDDLRLETALAIGNHDLLLRATGDQGQVRLWWQPPQGEREIIPAWALYSFPISSQGLLGKYYANPDWEGTPQMERIDPILDVYFHLTPLPRPYSVEWTGALNAPESGVYRLGLRAVDEARLYLDDQLIVEAKVPDEYVEEPIYLEAGPHDLRITYQDLTGRSRIHMYWKRPSGENEIIPARYLWPGHTEPRSPQPPTLPSPVEDLAPLELNWQATWGEPGDGSGQFLEPRDVAVIDDTVFIADTGNRRVQAWNRDGSIRSESTGGEEPFQEPLALDADSQDRLLVLDSPEGWIYRFDSEGRPLDRIGGPVLQAYHPRGMTVFKNDTLVLADTGGGRLLFLTSTGDIKRQIGETGQGLSQFSEPTDIAVDERGVYYVVEAYNQRVQLVDNAGGGLVSWPIPHSIAYDGPHLALAPDGSLLITAPEEGAIQHYSPDGRLLDQWTQAGPTPLCQPVGIYLDEATRTLYVTDTACHQVYVFEIDSAPSQ